MTDPQGMIDIGVEGVERAEADDLDTYYDYEESECYNCGGEGFYSSCMTEYACMYPDEGCDLCTRRCDVCQPRKPNPELQQVLADALDATKDTPAHEE